MTTHPGDCGNTAFLDAVRESVLRPVSHPRPIVLIGAGGIARDAHLPAYRKASLPVAAVVDADLSKAESLARDFGVSHATASIQEAIARTSGDRVFDVAVPAPALLKVLPLLPDGAAVLIQKPMGETLDEAHQIVDLCHRKEMIAAVNFQLRWAPVMLAARRITDAGLIGQLHDVEVQVSVHMPWQLWSFLSTAPRLEVLYHSIHYIDLIRASVGKSARRLCEDGSQPAYSGARAHKDDSYDGLWRLDARPDFHQPQPRFQPRDAEELCAMGGHHWRDARGHGSQPRLPARETGRSHLHSAGGKDRWRMAYSTNRGELVSRRLYRLDDLAAAICKR